MMPSTRDATQEDAEANITTFAREINAELGCNLWIGPAIDERDGRWSYSLLLKGALDAREERKVVVAMPGCKLNRVKFERRVGQYGWDYPDLRINGCNWLWCYARETAIAILGSEDA